MKNILKKFLSRKFLIAIVGILAGLAVALGADASEIQQIAGAVSAAVSAVSYILGEAMIDAAAAKQKDESDSIPSEINLTYDDMK